MSSKEPEPSPDCDRSVCGICGTPQKASRLGLQCPICLLNLARGFGAEDDLAPGEAFDGPFQERRFGDYRLLEEIARGGMGIVYRARQISLDREVAVKMILAGELAGKTALRMFQVEALAAANLHHPNIVPVYEIGEHEMQHYFSMRFVPGGQTIADWAAEHRRNFPAIAAAVAKVARAVDHAHRRSVIHRDLKPSNILWDVDAGPQITDFGLAKLLNAGDGTVTLTAQAIGSPSYMAPEQMRGRASEITTLTDVYGIGAVLYEMLAGRPPFEGETPLETMRRAAEEPPEPIPGVPAELRLVCWKCLAKAQEDRYPSGAALAEDLERFSRGEPISVAPLSRPQTLWRWARRKPVIAGLAGLCLGLFFTGLGGVLWEWRTAETARQQQALALDRLHWEEIDRWLEDGDAPQALAYLASLIRKEPARWPAVMYAMSIIDTAPVPVLAGPEIHPPAELTGGICLEPGGSWLAAAGKDDMVRVWDASSGIEAARFPQTAPITALAAASTPARLAIALKGGGLTLVSASAVAQPLQSPAASSIPLDKTGRDSILELHFSADGSRLLTRSKSSIEIWQEDSAGFHLAQTFALGAELKGAGLSQDGARAYAWNAKEAAVWNTVSGDEMLRVAAREKFQRGVLAASGARLAFLDGEYTTRVWDIDSQNQFAPIERPFFPARYLAMDAAGKRLTIAGMSDDLQVIDVESGLQISPPMKHHYEVNWLEASADGSRAVSLGSDDVVKSWDAQTGRPTLAGIAIGRGFRSHASLFPSRDGSSLLVHIAARAGIPESLTVWRPTQTRSPQRRSVKGEKEGFDAARISPDGHLGCLGLDSGNRSYIYELATGRTLLDVKVEGPVYAHLFSPDQRNIYALTANGWLHGWSLATGAELWPPNHQSGLIRPAAVSPDGSRIIVGHTDGCIRVHDAATGKLVQTLSHPGEVKVLRFAPDGSGRFLSASTDGLAHLWDLKTGALLRTFAGHTDAIISGAWSPDSCLIATASYDRTARLWDVATGKAVGAVMQHEGSLSHVEFSPDGARLATACRDGTARLWQPRTGLPVSPPLRQGSSCETVRFTRDSAALFVRDHDGFRFWDAALGEPITVHYVEPEVSGLGMDSESYRAAISADGTSVFLGHSLKLATLWSVPQPRGRAPAWLPDFLDTLGQTRVRSLASFPSESAAQLAARIRQQAGPNEELATWAARVLESPHKDAR